jgi:hypothetical protein
MTQSDHYNLLETEATMVSTNLFVAYVSVEPLSPFSNSNYSTSFIHLLYVLFKPVQQFRTAARVSGFIRLSASLVPTYFLGNYFQLVTMDKEIHFGPF